MKNWKPLLTLWIIVSGLVGCTGQVSGEAPWPAPEGALTVTDSTGKEHQLKTWKFLLGTRRLSWLTPATVNRTEKDAPSGARPKSPPGPEALELREENSTNFEQGILTLVPLDRIRSVEFDNDKQTITVHVAAGDKAENDVVLTGSTRFKNHNKLIIEAEVNKGDLGVAEIKFQGGTPRGLRAIRFPSPKAASVVAGRPAVVTSTDKEKSTHAATDLQPLYQTARGSLRIVPTLLFKKTLKLDLAKIQSLQLAEQEDNTGTSFTVKLKDGEEQTLTLLLVAPVDDKPARLVGLVGRVPAGYQLFPLLTVAAIEFDGTTPLPPPPPPAPK